MLGNGATSISIQTLLLTTIDLPLLASPLDGASLLILLPSPVFPTRYLYYDKYSTVVPTYRGDSFALPALYICTYTIVLELLNFLFPTSSSTRSDPI